MVTAYRGMVRDGQIKLEEREALPDGTEVIVVVVEAKKKSVLTARELAESEIVGLWADRDDIVDSAEYARQLREQAQRRDHAGS